LVAWPRRLLNITEKLEVLAHDCLLLLQLVGGPPLFLLPLLPLFLQTLTPFSPTVCYPMQQCITRPFGGVCIKAEPRGGDVSRALALTVPLVGMSEEEGGLVVFSDALFCIRSTPTTKEF
jgi:hypothetical protein